MKFIEIIVYLCILELFRSGSHPGRSLVKLVRLKQGCKWDENETIGFPDMLPSPGAALGQHTIEERDFPSLRHVPKGISDVEGEQNASKSDSRSEPTMLHCSHKHPRKASSESGNASMAFSSSASLNPSPKTCTQRLRRNSSFS